MAGFLPILARIVGAQVIAIPLAFFVILAMVPVFRSLERSTGIEMIGHSGPADWVIFCIWAVISLLITATLLATRKPKRKTADD